MLCYGDVFKTVSVLLTENEDILSSYMKHVENKVVFTYYCCFQYESKLYI